VIVSHGQPSDPDRAERALAALAGRVAALLPGWTIGSATLAQPGALAAAVSGGGAGGRAFPVFMAGGWFTRSHLPAKLVAAGAVNWQVLEPLGCDPALHDLVIHQLRQAAPQRVLLAAHGSFKSPVPSDIAYHLAQRITAETGIPAQAAFIDQDPQLATATGFGPDAVCLPFFAAEGGHVTDDIPAALNAAGFQGRLLPAIGLADDIPHIIARAIAAGNPVCMAECRWRRSG
jgi:sirohydrochlorin ferrochelatase